MSNVAAIGESKIFRYLSEMAYIVISSPKKNGKRYMSLVECRRNANGQPRQHHIRSLGPGGGANSSGEEVKGWLRRQVQPEPGMYLGLKMQQANDKLRAEQEEKEAKPSYAPKGTPTAEEEAMHAQWSASQAAERDEAMAEHGDPVSEAEAAAGGPGGGPTGETD
jgi:hypothetical protein